MNLSTLETLVARWEVAKVDFKRECRLDIGDSPHLAKRRSDLAWDVAAIANSRGAPGYLVIGIDEMSRLPVVGGAIGIGADQVQQILASHCQPSVDVDVEIVRWSTDEPILVITIPRSERKPHQVKGRGYPIRRGATTQEASHHDLREMFQETGGLDSGQTLMRQASLTDLDFERVVRYLIARGHSLTDPEQLPIGVLRGHDMVRQEDGSTYPTVAAILLFGRSPQIYLPHATISLTRQGEDAGTDLVDRLVARGTFIEQIQAAEGFFRRNLAGHYPIEVFREAIVNALIHRDYGLNYAEIVVRLVANQVEVISPGLLVGGLSIERLDAGPIDSPPRRNPSLVNLFFDQNSGPNADVRYIERAGSGLNRMRERLAEVGLPLPEFRIDEEQRLFKVLLRGVPLASSAALTRSPRHVGLSPRQSQFVDEKIPRSLTTPQEYRERFRISRATATAELRQMVQAGWLIALGLGAARRYERTARTD